MRIKTRVQVFAFRREDEIQGTALHIAVAVFAALAAATWVPAQGKEPHTQFVTPQVLRPLGRPVQYLIVNPGGLGGTQARSNSINN